MQAFEGLLRGRQSRTNDSAENPNAYFLIQQGLYKE